jgi:hypothetical protein
MPSFLVGWVGLPRTGADQQRALAQIRAVRAGNMLSGHADGRKATPKPIRRRRDHLTSLAGIIAEMGRIYRRMRAGKLDATEAQKRVWVLDRMRAGVADMALERIEHRLAELGGTQATRLIDGEYANDQPPQLTN